MFLLVLLHNYNSSIFPIIIVILDDFVTLGARDGRAGRCLHVYRGHVRSVRRVRYATSGTIANLTNGEPAFLTEPF